MKRLSILLIVLLLILTGCQTVPEDEPFNIPTFSVLHPYRPTLETIPLDTQAAIKALTTNMSILVNHVEKWEVYNTAKDSYYQTIFKIVTQ